MRYVRSLDGIRGVAVLLVILFHCGLFHAGWVGVQIFFTLSGFLITRILLADRGSTFPVYLGRFYWRRALRIFPLYLFFLLAATASWRIWGVPESFADDWPYLFTYTANFARIRDADLGPAFTHVWSLALEEQFYLLWPFVLYLLPPKALKAAVVAILFVAPTIRFVLFVAVRHAGYDPYYAGKLAYVLPFTQFDAFALGAAIRLWRLDRIKRAGSLFLVTLGILGVAGLWNVLTGHYLRGGVDKWAFGYPMFLVDAYGYVWGYSLLNFVSAAAIICTLQQVQLTRLLENPALVRIGKVSYGVYIYHLPALLVGRWCFERLGLRWNPVSHSAFFVVYLVAVLALAEASFRWLETPFLRLKDVWGSQQETEAGLASLTSSD